MPANTRAEQSRINGSKSKGPSSAKGKSISRKNSIKHGLAATVLALPNEAPDLIQSHIAEWADAIEPTTLQESELTRQVAEHSIRIGRINLAESAMLAEQVASVEAHREAAEQDRLADLTEFLWKDAPRAVIDLKRFRAGVDWLIERWEFHKETLEKQGTIGSLGRLRESLRLQGYDPEMLEREQSWASEWALWAASSFSDRATNRELNTYLDSQLGPPVADTVRRFEGQTPAHAVAPLLAAINSEISSLTELRDSLEDRESRSLERAKLIAQVPDDTPKNRLLLRYMKEAHADFNRSFKLLEKTRSDRRKEAEKAEKLAAKESRQAIFRNEPEAAQIDMAEEAYVEDSKPDLAVDEKQDNDLLIPIECAVSESPRVGLEIPDLGPFLPFAMAV